MKKIIIFACTLSLGTSIALAANFAKKTTADSQLSGADEIQKIMNAAQEAANRKNISNQLTAHK